VIEAGGGETGHLCLPLDLRLPARIARLRPGLLSAAADSPQFADLNALERLSRCARPRCHDGFSGTIVTSARAYFALERRELVSAPPARKAVSKPSSPLRGTEGSNPASSSEESANYRFRGAIRGETACAQSGELFKGAFTTRSIKPPSQVLMR